MKQARNVLILMALAAVVTFLPGGGSGALLVGAILSIAFAGAMALFAARFYQERRVDLYGLGDGPRAVLYGSLALLVLALAASSRLLASNAGTLAMIVIVALCVVGLMRSYQAMRQL